MKIKVLFFGRFREELDCAQLELDLVEGADLDSLRSTLGEGKGARWTQVLGQANLITAVNQEVANDNLGLADGDEVAFFPPVTGG